MQALEKSTIQLSEPDTFITSNYFKAVLQVQADSVAGIYSYIVVVRTS